MNTLQLLRLRTNAQVVRRHRGTDHRLDLILVAPSHAFEALILCPRSITQRLRSSIERGGVSVSFSVYLGVAVRILSEHGRERGLLEGGQLRRGSEAREQSNNDNNNHHSRHVLGSAGASSQIKII